MYGRGVRGKVILHKCQARRGPVTAPFTAAQCRGWTLLGCVVGHYPWSRGDVDAKGVPITLLTAGPQPYRGSVLEDKEHSQEGRGTPSRSVGRSHSLSDLGAHARRRGGLVRPLRLLPTGSILMNAAVEVSPVWDGTNQPLPLQLIFAASVSARPRYSRGFIGASPCGMHAEAIQ